MAAPSLGHISELTDRIIDILWSDRQSLLNCSLVCRRFLPRCQYHIFRCMTVLWDREWEFQQLLYRAPRFAPYMTSLIFIAGKGKLDVALAVKTFERMSSKLPKLDKLTLENFVLLQSPEHLLILRALETAFPTITEITLVGEGPFYLHDLANFTAAHSRLKALRASDYPPIASNTPPVQMCITTLEINLNSWPPNANPAGDLLVSGLETLIVKVWEPTCLRRLISLCQSNLNSLVNLEVTLWLTNNHLPRETLDEAMPDFPQLTKLRRLYVTSDEEKAGISCAFFGACLTRVACPSLEDVEWRVASLGVPFGTQVGDDILDGIASTMIMRLRNNPSLRIKWCFYPPDTTIQRLSLPVFQIRTDRNILTLGTRFGHLIPSGRMRIYQSTDRPEARIWERATY